MSDEWSRSAMGGEVNFYVDGFTRDVLLRLCGNINVFMEEFFFYNHISYFLFSNLSLWFV